MTQKPSVPTGTRDFLPSDMVRRNFIFDTIKEVFQKYGYMPVETPSMENLETLLGKYGEEGDKLLFKILNSGNFLSKVDEDLLMAKDFNRLAGQVSDKGLRYDLTVPFARFVVQHQNELIFPFKRYQIQPVWRADRPQKGRYREFYQCDIDVIGSGSLLNEVELIQVVDEVFERLNLRVAIKMNNRKVLMGIAEIIHAPDKIIDITIAIDKLDKVGLEQVNKELLEKGINQSSVNKLQPLLTQSGNNEEKLTFLKELLKDSEIGIKGIEELEVILSLVNELNLVSLLDIDLTLARGLNYYTGAIFEVKSMDLEIGSITGGGRYDDLTGIFGLENVSGVGISFGAERIFDVMNHLNLYPTSVTTTTPLLFVNFGDFESTVLKYASFFRDKGIRTEVFPDAIRLKNQMAYANKRNIQFVAMIGETEMTNKMITIKNMQTGEQQTLTLEEALAKIKNDLTK